jgi:mycofactocin precursor
MLAGNIGTQCHLCTHLRSVAVTTSPANVQQVDTTDESIEAPLDDSLIEDVSIDGMCGVY